MAMLPFLSFLLWKPDVANFLIREVCFDKSRKFQREGGDFQNIIFLPWRLVCTVCLFFPATIWVTGHIINLKINKQIKKESFPHFISIGLCETHWFHNFRWNTYMKNQLKKTQNKLQCEPSQTHVEVNVRQHNPGKGMNSEGQKLFLTCSFCIWAPHHFTAVKSQRETRRHNFFLFIYFHFFF